QRDPAGTPAGPGSDPERRWLSIALRAAAPFCSVCLLLIDGCRNMTGDQGGFLPATATSSAARDAVADKTQPKVFLAAGGIDAHTNSWRQAVLFPASISKSGG
ncbi:MAG: hypothetical protein QNI88_17775, partial [Desulfobacterales bacterium]|nr:hypothetical protein [Desulfobacterales bacterium]